MLVNFAVVVVMSGVVGVAMFMRRHSLVTVAGRAVPCALAKSVEVAHREARHPDEHTQRRPGADDRADLWLS